MAKLWQSYRQALALSGPRVVMIRPTVFLEGFFPLIELPFGQGKTSPVATADVARVIAPSSPIPGRTMNRSYHPSNPNQEFSGLGHAHPDVVYNTDEIHP